VLKWLLNCTDKNVYFEFNNVRCQFMCMALLVLIISPLLCYIYVIMCVVMNLKRIVKGYVKVLIIS
jgi:hypothetical protein